MKLTNNTRINSILFKDEVVKDEVVFSANLNTTFQDYIQASKRNLKNAKNNDLKKKTNLDDMLAFDYKLDSIKETTKYTFSMYSYKDDRFTASFIELKEKK